MATSWREGVDQRVEVAGGDEPRQRRVLAHHLPRDAEIGGDTGIPQANASSGGSPNPS